MRRADRARRQFDVIQLHSDIGHRNGDTFASGDGPRGPDIEIHPAGESTGISVLQIPLGKKYVSLGVAA